MEARSAGGSQNIVLLFTDVVGSTDLKSRHGTITYARLLRRHNQIFEDCCRPIVGHQILKHTGDGYFATFATASDAVRVALMFQQSMRAEAWSPEPLATRVGIHAGEVAVMTMIGKQDVVGYAADVAARVMSLGVGGQILMTRGVFDDARQFIHQHPDTEQTPSPKLRWLAHGAYLFKGSDRPMEIFEVGAEGLAPLTAPADAEKARRIIPAGESRFLGWRPGRGQTIPNRQDWKLNRCVRHGEVEETWIGIHKQTGERRSFRFLFDDPRTRSVVREAQTVAGENEPAVDTQLDQSPAFIATRPSPDELNTPEVIGPYQLQQILGEGGMGTVYKAEQLEPIRRTVALKVIKLGMDTKDVIARFEAERQALALMEHPGIAKVFDAGATETGRPYFVMEFVAGEPITGYCDRHNLTTSKRLELFVAVCDAVQHAHTKGVIHRDIKPSNVLVSMPQGENKPIVKIIDFGVAKATTAKLTEKSLFTEQGRLIGTPEYMSPEQAEMNALDIDTRADVYSLGVLLYELLSGATPFDSQTLRSAAYGEIQRIIREVDPPRLSTRLSSMGDRAAGIAKKRQAELQKLSEELSGELEWIPLKAMRKNRAERYETARDLARDVQNYLSGMPLLAGPETAAYRVRKWVKRYRKPIAVFGSAAAVAVVATVVAFVLISRARAVAVAERDRARAARDEADRNYRAARSTVNDYLLAVSQNELLRRRGLDTLRRKLLDRAVQYHEQFLSDRKDDPAAKVDLAQSRRILAVLKGENGDPTSAIEGLNQSVEQLRSTVIAQRNSAESRLQLAQSLVNLGMFKSRIASGPALLAAAEPAYEEAIAILRDLAKSAGTTNIQAELANALSNWAAVLADAEKFEESNAALKEALTARKQLAQAQPNNPRFSEELGTTMHAIALLWIDRDPQRAAAAFEEALRIREQLATSADATTEQLAAQADTANLLAETQLRMKQPERAAESNRRAIATLSRIADDSAHTGDAFRAGVFEALSWAKLLANDPAGAIKAAERGIDYDRDNPHLKVNLGHALAIQGNTADAVNRYREAAALLQTTIHAQLVDDAAVLSAAGVNTKAISAISEQMR